MGDYYTEQLIKKVVSIKDIMIKAGLITATALVLLVALMAPIFGALFIVMIVLDVILFRRLNNVEYEYLYVNGELDIDKIINKAKRKRMFSMNISDLEIIVPSGSADLNSYKNIKILNFSSMRRKSKTYEMILIKGGEKLRVIFEPNQAILEGMRMLAPRKVKI